MLQIGQASKAVCVTATIGLKWRCMLSKSDTKETTKVLQRCSAPERFGLRHLPQPGHVA